DTSDKLGYAALPMELGVLIDNAKLCSLKGADKTLRQWLSQLPQSVHRSSRVSVLTYTSHRLEILASRLSPEDVMRVAVECEGNSLSTNPERAIERFLKIAEGTEFPVRIWLATGGNIQIPTATLERL